MSETTKERSHELKMRRGARTAECTCGRWSVELPAKVDPDTAHALVEDAYELHDSRALR